MRARATVLASLVVATALIPLLWAPRATADGGGCGGYLGVYIGCGANTEVSTPASSAPPGPGAPSSPATTIPVDLIEYVPYVIPRGNGSYCVAFTETILPAPLNPADGQNAGAVSIFLIGVYGLCPGAPVPPALAVNPAVLAAQFWQTIPLPVPKPTIPPGYAITGKPAYLVTDGTVDPPSWTNATPLGPLTVTAHGTYRVDWGDGSTTGPFSAEGQPYPQGSIVHTYDVAGTATVTVTEQWTATWTLGAAGGALQQLQTQAAIPDLRIQQLQAVLTH